jgi:type II secretory pathway pseudopilin PulG
MNRSVMQSWAFSLVELIVVMAIILTVSSLIIALLPRIRRSADLTVTGSRIQDVTSALQMTTTGGSRAADLQRRALSTRTLTAAGADAGTSQFDTLEMRPLRDVISQVISGRTFADLAINRRTMVPNIAFSRAAALCTASTASLVAADWIPYTDAGHPFPNRAAATMNDVSLSTMGERLEDTLEAWPSGLASPPTLAWFRMRWPTSWPVADWDQPSPGRIPVRWGSPWGRNPLLIGPNGVTEGPIPAVRNLGELSPLDSIALLQAAGILEEGTTGAQDYRQDRGKGKRWNDRWGNPLVVVSAAFQPNRHEANARLITAPAAGASSWPARWATIGYAFVSPSTYVAGQPRDAMIQAYRQQYGSASAIYLAVGAVGPVLRTPLPTTWTSTEDAVALRNLWLQIRDTAQASLWTENGFRTPPWSGVRRGKFGDVGVSGAALSGEICLLDAPIELH